MPTKPGIRVIKKVEMKKVDELALVESKPKKDGASDMVRTVMNRVNELKNRKFQETRLAVKQFQPYG